MVLVLQASMTQTRRHALATAAGLGMARACHVALAAVGLAALLRAAPLAFDAVRLAGAAYLVWIGIAILRAPGASIPAFAPAAVRRAAYLAAWRRGFLTNLLNPKALIFCSLLLPQFIRADAPVGPQFLVLGGIVVATGVAFDLSYALAGARLQRVIETRPAVGRVQRWLFALLLIGFGAHLAVVPALAGAITPAWFSAAC